MIEPHRTDAEFELGGILGIPLEFAC